MNKQIKESFDQIHAPEFLIEDTKRKLHEAEAKKTSTTKQQNIHWKTITGTACALAACAVIMVTGYNFFNTSPSSPNVPEGSGEIADLKEQSDSLNATDNTSINEFTFEGTKQLNDWYQLLENSDLKGEERIQLEENYAIFTFYYPKGEDEYQINIVLEQGVIDFVHSQPVLQGDFKAEVYYQGKQLTKTSLNITSNCQFLSKDAAINLQDVNQDGQPDFSLETEHNQGNDDTLAWFTLDENCNIIEMSKQ